MDKNLGSEQRMLSVSVIEDAPRPLRKSCWVSKIVLPCTVSRRLYFFLPFVLSTTSTQFLCTPRFSSAFNMASFCGP